MPWLRGGRARLVDVFCDMGSTMNIPEEKKIDILSAQLQERYVALHNMRDRSMRFVLWVLGFGLALAWVSISEAVFTFGQKIAITGLLLTFAIVADLFVRAIHCGFNANRQTMIRIEKALGLYDPGSYGTAEGVLPRAFADSNPGWTGHFGMLYLLVSIITILLLVLTWTNPCGSARHVDQTILKQGNTQTNVAQ